MKCITKYCRNDAAEGYDLCPKCRSRQYKKKYPFKYYYNVLRLNASRREIQFELSFERFKELWLEHPKRWEEKLKQRTCRWEVDRIRAWEGYTDDNVQLLTKRENIRKYAYHDKFTMDVRWEEVPDLKGILEEAPF